MATARARHGSYLFQRPGSENFYVKLRSPTGRVEKSLRTSDRREAEVAGRSADNRTQGRAAWPPGPR